MEKENKIVPEFKVVYINQPQQPVEKKSPELIAELRREKYNSMSSDKKEIYLSKMRARAKKYYLVEKNNPNYKKKKAAYLKKYFFERRRTDTFFRVRQNIGIRLSGQVRKIQGCSDIGFSKDLSIIDLKERLESQFTPEMSWGNYGSYWEVDHITPLSLFSSIEELKAKGNSLDNLQPVPVAFNRSKRNSLEVFRW